MSRHLSSDVDLSSDIRTRPTWSTTISEVQLGSVADGSMTLSHTSNAPTFTEEKEVHCDIKFVKPLESSDLTERI